MLLKGKMKYRLFPLFNGAAAFQANNLPDSLSSSWDARGLDPPLGCKPSSSSEPVGALCSGGRLPFRARSLSGAGSPFQLTFHCNLHSRKRSSSDAFTFSNNILSNISQTVFITAFFLSISAF